MSYKLCVKSRGIFIETFFLPRNYLFTFHVDSFKRVEHVKKRAAMVHRKIGRVTWNDLASQMIEDGNSQIDRINEKGSRTSVKLKESL